MKAVPIKALDELVESGVIQLTRGKIISKKDIAACPGSFPIYSSAKDNDGKFGEYGKFLFDEELITWSVDGGGRLFHRPKHKFSVTNVGGILRILDRSVLDYRYLYYVLSLRHSEISFDWVRKAHPSIIKKLYQNIPVPTLPEQQRIVGILDKAFEGIATAKANAETNLQNARALFESFLNLAIQGKLIPQNFRDASAAELISQIEMARNDAVDQGRAKPEKTDPVKIRDEGRIKLPNSWKWVRLESLTVGISDGVHKKPQYVSNGIPFITVKNLTSGPSISFDDLNYITRKDHVEFIKRTHPERGDILVTKDGTIGVVRLVETEIEFSIFVSVALIKPVIRELGPYVVYALRASCVQSQMVPQGAALKHLYLVDLRRLAIPLPPMAEQMRIVATLDALKAETQRLASIYERKLAALEALKKSLLHQAFIGEL